MRLDSLGCIEDSDSSVEDSHGPLYLDREIHVSRSVDDIDLAILPETSGRSGSDGDSPFLLLSHPIHGGLTLMDLSDLMRLSSIEKDAFRSRGLPGINVGDDTDIPELSHVINKTSHKKYE